MQVRLYYRKNVDYCQLVLMIALTKRNLEPGTSDSVEADLPTELIKKPTIYHVCFDHRCQSLPG